MSDKDRGFTLIEVLIALAILAGSLAVLLAAISFALDRRREARADQAATLLLQSLMTRASTERPVQTGETSGEVPGGIHWDVRVSRYGSQNDRASWPVNAYSVRASVRWHGTSGVREKSLTTLRIAPP